MSEKPQSGTHIAGYLYKHQHIIFQERSVIQMNQIQFKNISKSLQKNLLTLPIQAPKLFNNKIKTYLQQNQQFILKYYSLIGQQPIQKQNISTSEEAIRGKYISSLFEDFDFKRQMKNLLIFIQGNAINEFNNKLQYNIESNLETPQSKYQTRMENQTSISQISDSDLARQLEGPNDNQTPEKSQIRNVQQEQQINQQNEDNQKNEQISSNNNLLPPAKNYGFKLQLDQMKKAQQIQQNEVQQFDTERSLHFEETDFNNQNPLKGSELSNGQPFSSVNELDPNYKPSAGKAVRKVPIPPTHSSNYSSVGSSNSFVFRTGQSYIGVSQMLASGFSKYHSPRRSPRKQLTNELSQANSSAYNQKFHSGLLDQSETNKKQISQQYPLTDRDNISDVKSSYSKLLTSRDDIARQKMAESSNQSAKLFQTIIRLDSEIKKLRNEPLRESSKDVNQRLKFGEEGGKQDDAYTNGRSKTGSQANTNIDDSHQGLDIEELILQNKQLKRDVQELRQYKIQASQSHIVAQINKDLAKKQELLQNENQDLQEQLMDLQGQLQKMREDFEQQFNKNEKLNEEFTMLRRSTHDHSEFLNIKTVASEATKEIDHLQHLVSQREAEIESLKKDIKELQERRENNSVNENIKNLNQKINELTNQNRELQGEKLALVDQIESTQKESLSVVEENRNLEKRLKETIQYLDEKSEKLAKFKIQYDANWKELEILRDESQQLKNKLTIYDDRFKVFNLLKSGDEDSVLKMNCQLILRKNAFDKYMIHIESVSEITILMATDVTDLIPSKNGNSFFQIGFRGPNNKKHNATFEATSRQEMVSICKTLKTYLISAQNSQNQSLSSTSSSPKKQIRVEPNKDFLSSISTFFGS